MKQRFLNYALSSIRSAHPEYDDTVLGELRYGLEGLYLTVTKLIIIFVGSAVLGIFKEMLTLLIIFNITRTTGFGLHASKSWICLLSSSCIFLLLPFVAKIIIIPFYFKWILGIIAIILMFLYAPADTKKRPLIRKHRRERYKFITTITCIILVTLMLFIENQILSNLLLFGIYTEVVMILPLTYKMFHLSYNNYKTYHLQLD